MPHTNTTANKKTNRSVRTHAAGQSIRPAEPKSIPSMTAIVTRACRSSLPARFYRELLTAGFSMGCIARLAQYLKRTFRNCVGGFRFGARPTDAEREIEDGLDGNETAQFVIADGRKPMEAAQPHCEQSGLPPNWQGVMRLVRSAEMLVVVCAKMQSLGEAGGWQIAGSSLAAYRAWDMTCADCQIGDHLERWPAKSGSPVETHPFAE